MLAHRRLHGGVQCMGIDPEDRRKRCGNPRLPVEPDSALGAGLTEDLPDDLGTVNQFAFEAGQAGLVGLRLDHRVDRAGLQERGVAGWYVPGRGASVLRAQSRTSRFGSMVPSASGAMRPVRVDFRNLYAQSSCR